LVLGRIQQNNAAKPSKIVAIAIARNAVSRSNCGDLSVINMKERCSDVGAIKKQRAGTFIVRKDLTTWNFRFVVTLGEIRMEECHHPLMKKAEVAQWLNCSERHLQNLMKTPDFPKPVYLMSAVRFNPEEIERYINGKSK
jgi:predicted DNA-binding transcriptional regulator AlpA